MINELNSINEIYKILDEFTPYLRTLSSGIVDKYEFSNKIYRYGKFIILRTENRVVGFAAFYCNDLKNREAYLSYIAVKPQFSRMGFGKNLLNEVERISFTNGMKSLKLEVFYDNKAIEFYKKQRFQINGYSKRKTVYMIKLLA